MDAENQVSLNIGGKSYTKWESVSITSALDAVSMSFNLGVTAEHESTSDSILPCRAGDTVTIKIGNDLVLSGYVEATPMSYDAKSVSAAVKGHSKTVDLMECTPILTADDYKEFSKNTSSWLSSRTNKNYVQVPTFGNGIQWNGLKLKEVIAQLIAPYSIRLVVEGSTELNQKLNKVVNFSASPTDTVLKCIQNLTANEDLLFYCDEEGDLVVGDRGIKTASVDLVLGTNGNILKAESTFDATKRFHTYRVTGTIKGSNNSIGIKNNTPKGIATDSFVKRTRLLTTTAKGEADSSTCQKKADGDLAYYAANYYKITYTVQGWREKPFGPLWKINSKVHVKDRFLGIDLDLVISKVTFNLTNQGGMTTQIEVVPLDGLKVPNENSKTVSPSKSVTTTNLSWINTSKGQTA